ncbi:hypothetical protein BU202_08300 [Streptococcus cuniculi]|uniref:Uncharacterized protein n=1 Tax=Streptococcus cuniculi TaxID=1432788 RepID=A0A1Q8E6B1_9STRE|nr:hypothetical protein [Streptococcus cuniculi]OLF47318.1 hypothetical protein BU202_08300 [Streptococcus cuniculi]QBX23172.1 hypothetical protein Javan116_0043 [Streptococcus phage Javan116]
MKTIKFNDEVVVVPADVIIMYMKYRKFTRELEAGYSEGIHEVQEQAAMNIMNWAYSNPKLKEAILPDLVPEFEKVVNSLI